MSRTRSVSLVAYALMAPPEPADAIAALALMRPSRELMADTAGCACPVGQTVRYPSEVWGTTVTFSAYAWALEGMPQELLGITKLRDVPAARYGPPNGPTEFRVSATRQGDTGTSMSPCCPNRTTGPETNTSSLIVSMCSSE